MKKLIGVAAAIAALSMPVALSTTGQVAAAQYDCNTGQTCLWVNASFGGVRLYSTVDINALSNYNFNDRASSGFNRMTVTTKTWTNNDCQGNSESLAAGVAKSQLSNNDSASSLDVVGQAACGS